MLEFSRFITRIDQYIRLPEDLETAKHFDYVHEQTLSWVYEFTGLEPLDWSTGLEYWSTGVLEYWITGALEPNLGATKNKTIFSKQTNKQTNKQILESSSFKVLLR